MPNAGDPVSLPPFPAPEPEMVEAPMATLPLGLEPISAAPRAFALAPSAGSLDALSYYAYAGFDYVPLDTPPNLVSVTVRLPCALLPRVTFNASFTVAMAHFNAPPAFLGCRPCWVCLCTVHGVPVEATRLPVPTHALPGGCLLPR